MSLFKKAAQNPDAPERPPVVISPIVRARMLREAAWSIELDAEGYYAKLPAEDIPWVALSHVRGWNGRDPLRAVVLTEVLTADLPTALGRGPREIAKTFRITAEKVQRQLRWTDEQKLAVSRRMKEAWIDRRERYGVSGISPGSYQYLTKRQKEDINAIVAALHVDPRQRTEAA